MNVDCVERVLQEKIMSRFIWKHIQQHQHFCLALMNTKLLRYIHELNWHILLLKLYCRLMLNHWMLALVWQNMFTWWNQTYLGAVYTQAFLGWLMSEGTKRWNSSFIQTNLQNLAKQNMLPGGGYYCDTCPSSRLQSFVFCARPHGKPSYDFKQHMKIHHTLVLSWSKASCAFLQY